MMNNQITSNQSIDKRSIKRRGGDLNSCGASTSGFRDHRLKPSLATPATDKIRQKLNQTLFYMSIDSDEGNSEDIKDQRNKNNRIKQRVLSSRRSKKNQYETRYIDSDEQK